jgi:uncharacterized membrane protein
MTLLQVWKFKELKIMNKILQRFFPGFISLVALLWASSVFSAPVQIRLFGDGRTTVSFSFIDGGPQTNSVTMSKFKSPFNNAVIGSSRSIGDVTGNFPGSVTLTDAAFFNEYQLDVDTKDPAFAWEIDFILNTTSNGPVGNAFADAYAITFLDPLTGLPIDTTTDPTGADASLLWSIDGELDSLKVEGFNASLGRFSAGADPVIDAPVPAPGTLGLMFWGVLALVSRSRQVSKSMFGRLGSHTWIAIRRRSTPAFQLGLLALFFGQNVFAAQSDVTSSLTVKRSGFLFNRVTNTFDAKVSIINNSTNDVAAPMSLAISVLPASASLANATGATADGKATVSIPMTSNPLRNGGSISNVVLKFKNPSKLPFSVRIQVMGDLLPPLLQKYNVVPLSNIWRTASRINNSGVIVGTVYRIPKPGEVIVTSPPTEAAYLENGTLVRLGALDMVDSEGYGINDVGQIIGEAYSRGGSVFGFVKPFRYGNGVMTPLLTERLDGLSGIRGGKINNRGEIIRGLLLYRGASLTDLGPAIEASIPINFREWSRSVTGFNDSGQILLQFQRFVFGSCCEYRTFLYSSGSSVEINPGSEHPFNFGNDLNSAGLVVGRNREVHAFFWQNGSSIDLHANLTNGSAGQSEATKINGRGEIVGTLFSFETGSQSFLFNVITGRSVNLDRYFPIGGRFEPIDINDRGQILGSVTCDRIDATLCIDKFPFPRMPVLLDPLK